MGELLILAIVPPAVGLVTYVLLRMFWKTDDEVDRTPQLRLDINSRQRVVRFGQSNIGRIGQ